MDSTNLWPRQRKSYSTGQLTTEDLVNHALERKQALNARAQEEAARERKRRAQQRKALTESMLGEQRQYLAQLTAAFRGHKERSTRQAQDSPFQQDPFNEFHRGERSRHDASLRAETGGDRQFRATLNSTFGARTVLRDEFADACAEKRALVAREKELRTLMEAERGQQKRLAAEMRRGSFAEDVQRRRLEREDKDRMKQEFFRSLTSWDGKRAKPRTKSVKDLWKEHLEKMRQAEVASSLAASEGALTPAEPLDETMHEQEDDHLDFIEYEPLESSATGVTAPVS